MGLFSKFSSAKMLSLSVHRERCIETIDKMPFLYSIKSYVHDFNHFQVVTNK